METRTYEAKFPKAVQADEFAQRISEPGWSSISNIVHVKGRRTVLFDAPTTAEYRMAIAETIGYYGSPPQGPVATLDGHPTPRSY